MILFPDLCHHGLIRIHTDRGTRKTQGSLHQMHTEHSQRPERGFVAKSSWHSANVRLDLHSFSGVSAFPSFFLLLPALASNTRRDFPSFPLLPDFSFLISLRISPRKFMSAEIADTPKQRARTRIELMESFMIVCFEKNLIWFLLFCLCNIIYYNISFCNL